MSSEFESNLLKGKKGLIMGVANDKSIAWGIAKVPLILLATASAHAFEISSTGKITT